MAGYSATQAYFLLHTTGQPENGPTDPHPVPAQPDYTITNTGRTTTATQTMVGTKMHVLK